MSHALDAKAGYFNRRTWLTLAVCTAILAACAEQVSRRLAYPSPDGVTQLIWEEREGGGAAGSQHIYLYLERAPAPQVPIGKFPDLEDFNATWTSANEVRICANGDTPYWTDRTSMRVGDESFDVSIVSTCRLRVISDAARVEEYRRSLGD